MSENNINLPADPNQLPLKFLEFQKEELKVREKEIEARTASDERSYKYAVQSMQVQAGDLELNRTHQRDIIKKIFWFAGISLTLILGFFAYALYLNKDEIVKEFVKAILYIAAGGVGGYGYKSIKIKPNDPPAN
ncbi:MAG: hypothetical protein A3G32_03220 [Deltaproteobacteria bacterium RIFCSPLOWO2_12_FULL_40_28]|nr:MAG: hypothetical protein A3C45_01905 [Deltaproteobacteria bacterium RIFCSPHIGHO2_02_FULL_40_28]OGQ20109.1 MAG: hypothetical protein A3E27_01200 [Deltaproteobacteria bacterium RIFCSPHIGHO2_12_FULL_40_32]OGQ40680.1 MAG: hypothetical protein A3I69_02465 [Deltaproteobacteria bacterium RIFCSPLOWO2_02_FULL_40_36]OGQ54375.1 MAG: hypothetical protein A3G32_03220 [Deltaproteobacteria bacterium RIFCSPLOWO2_12_FULL_40_28]